MAPVEQLGPSLSSRGYWRAIAMRIWLSVSSIRSPETSTVTLCRVPVNRKGDVWSGLTGEPALAPMLIARGLITKAS
jgi:hypothetical protein